MSTDQNKINHAIRLTLRDRLFLLMLRSISKLSLKAVHKFCDILFVIAILFPFRFKRVIATHIRLCFPELNQAQQKALWRDAIRNTLYCLAEMPLIWFSQTSKILSYVKQVSGEEQIMAATHSGESIVILAPHLGSWEIFNIYGSALHPSACLYKPRKKAYQEAIIREARERSTITMLPTTASGVKGLYQALAEKKWVAMLADHDPGNNGGVFVPFFGIPANTMTLASRLAIKSRAKVFLAFAERLPHSAGFHIHFIPADSNLTNPDLTQAAIAMNQDIERCVRMAPAQYEWAYKRFRRRPNGEASIY